MCIKWRSMTAINKAKECFYERATQEKTRELNLCEPGGDCVVQLSILCNFPRTYFTEKFLMAMKIINFMHG